jgi:hypothetical protein
MPMPTRPPRPNSLIMLGKWVAEQAALGRISYRGVEQVYIKSGQSCSSRGVQIAKLRAFWRYGRKHKGYGILWLAGWQAHRLPGKSTYETLLYEVRQQL